MRAWLLALLLLLPLPAWSQASWLQIGDPQFGLDCATYDTIAANLYPDLGGDACLEKQMQQAIGLLDFAERKGVDFVVMMGDHNHAFGTNQNIGSPTRLKLGELQALFPTLTIRYTIGNHDYESSCQHLPKFMLDNASSGGTVRNPAWDYWVVNNVHFIIWPTSLFSQGTGGPNCAAGDTNQCIQVDGTLSVACTAGAGTDKEMVSTCGANEYCNDYSGWTTSAWTWLDTQIGAWVTAQGADPDARLFTFSHWPPWWQDDLSVTDSSTFSTTYRQNIEAAVAAGTTSAAKPFIMQYGHWHEVGSFGGDLMGYSNCNPALATGVSSINSINWMSVVSSGFVFGKVYGGESCAPPESNTVSAVLWEVDDAGVHTATRILATPQGGSLP